MPILPVHDPRMEDGRTCRQRAGYRCFRRLRPLQARDANTRRRFSLIVLGIVLMFTAIVWVTFKILSASRASLTRFAIQHVRNCRRARSCRESCQT